MSERPGADNGMSGELGGGLDPVAAARVRDAYLGTPGADDLSRARVLAAVGQGIAAGAPERVRAGLVLSWRLAALAAAVIFAVGALLGERVASSRDGSRTLARGDSSLGSRQGSGIGTFASSAAPRPVRFVLVARGATHVSLVGDFNGWNADSTPMQPYGRDGLWEVSLPVRAGRHVYAFVVDGSRWMTDPAAPRTLADGFGEPNSVLLVEEHVAGN